MPATHDVAVLIGSLRKESFTRCAVLALQSVAPNLTLRPVDIVISLYNQDLDTDAPPVDWARLRADIARADAVLFATPEYNRSVPGVLKNAIDVASRPSGKAALQGKPAAILSVTPGSMGAFGANHHLRQSAVFLDMPSSSRNSRPHSQRFSIAIIAHKKRPSFRRAFSWYSNPNEEA